MTSTHCLIAIIVIWLATAGILVMAYGMVLFMPVYLVAAIFVGVAWAAAFATWGVTRNKS